MPPLKSRQSTVASASPNPSLFRPWPALEVCAVHADRDVRRVPNPDQEFFFVHHALQGMPLVGTDEELANRRGGTRAAGL